MCRAKERARDVVIKSDILENMQSHAGGTGPHNLLLYCMQYCVLLQLESIEFFFSEVCARD